MVHKSHQLTVTLLVFINPFYSVEQQAVTTKMHLTTLIKVLQLLMYSLLGLMSPLISALLLLPPAASHHRITDDCQLTPYEQLSLPPALTL